MNAWPFAAGSLVALALGMFCPAARADGGQDGSEAARLFQEAKELMDQGRYAEACPKLDRSRALDPQVGTTLNLAFCYESLGKTASSWSTWLDGAAEAGAKGQADREALARRRAAQLESRLLRITILVAPQPDEEAIDLRLDGVPISKRRWGAPTPVDPGPHWVQATAEGKRTWFTAIQVDDQHVPLVRVAVLEVETRPEVVEAPAASLGHVPARRIAAVALGGLGVAALAGMSALALVAKSTYAGANCQGDACLKAGVDDRDRANTEAGLATAAATAGVAALAGAALLWFGSPRPRTGAQTGLTVLPAVGQDAWGLSLRGRW